MTTTLSNMWFAATETDLKWVLLFVAALVILAMRLDAVGAFRDDDDEV